MAVACGPGRSYRGALEAFEGRQAAASNADSSRWLWPECLVEAAAEGFRPLKAGKRQLRTPIVADGCGLRAWSKLPRRVLGCFRPLKAGKRQLRTPIVADGCGLRGPLKAGKRQLRTPIVADGCGLRAWSKLPRSVVEAFEGRQAAASNADSSKGLWPECLVEAAGRSCRGGF